MSEPVLLFPFLDVAMRAVAILILCALPLLLMPETRPRSDRRRPAARTKSARIVVTQTD